MEVCNMCMRKYSGKVVEANDAFVFACSDMAVLCVWKPARLSVPAYVLHKSCLGQVMARSRQGVLSRQVLASQASTNSPSSNEVSHSFAGLQKFQCIELMPYCCAMIWLFMKSVLAGRDQAPPSQQGSA